MGLGSMISGAVGGLLGAGASAAAGMISAKQQYKYAKKWAQKGPGYNVQGLRDAGLNPILAAKNPAGGGGPNIGPIAAPDPAGDVSKLSSAVQAKKMTKLLDEQINTEITKQNVNSAQTQKTISEAYSAMADARVREKSGNIQLNSKFLQVLDAINRSGGFGAASSASQLFRLLK